MEILWGGRRSRNRGCLSFVFSSANAFLLSSVCLCFSFLYLTSHFELLDTRKHPPTRVCYEDRN